MKRALFLLIVTASACVQGQTKADYTLPVHVSESHIGSACTTEKGTSSCKSTQELTVLIQGKKYLLRSTTFFSKGIVALGDYSAKIADQKEKPTGEFTRTYDLLFPDGSTRAFTVIGQME